MAGLTAEAGEARGAQHPRVKGIAMAYIDGFVAAVPTANRQRFIEHAKEIVEWPDKATRQSAMQKMSADPRMKNMQMPFDGRRLIYGGFESVFDLRK